MPWIIPEAVNISAYNPISPNNNKKKPQSQIHNSVLFKVFTTPVSNFYIHIKSCTYYGLPYFLSNIWL